MGNQSSSQSKVPIDVVIAWVDGTDPKLAEKRNAQLQRVGSQTKSSVRATHFASANEIRYCILSIFRFAPFIRNVFIVTDDQDPNIWDEVRTYFPERLSAIRIVDHKEIFKGFEEYLPTFNSISIGNMIWRIEGLSDNFVYFNDDIFLIREVSPDDWFLNNRPVLRGSWHTPPFLKIIKNDLREKTNRYLLHKPTYKPLFSFYIVQWHAASLLGMKIRYFINGHTPYVLNRKRLAEFFEDHIELFRENIAYRFRNLAQFNISTFFYHLEILNGNKNFAKLNSEDLNPAHHSEKRLNRRIRRCQTDSDIKSICVQSLDMASKDNQHRIYNLMDKFLDLKPCN